MTFRTISCIALVAAAVAISACGRKSDLDTPYQAGIDARKQAERNKEPLPPEPQKPVEDRKFFLDALI